MYKLAQFVRNDHVRYWYANVALLTNVTLVIYTVMSEKQNAAHVQNVSYMFIIHVHVLSHYVSDGIIFPVNINI